jgi:hypothetical protein
MSDTMPCLSLWQPWASLWCSPAKVHETRHWPWSQRGWVAVHATKKIVHELEENLADIVVDRFGPHWGMKLPRGAIIGMVDVLDCVAAERVVAAMKRDDDGRMPDDFYCGDFAAGRVAFRRGSYKLFTQPIPWRSSQGPFKIPAALVRDQT